MDPRRLYRSADDRILAGVAGGLADYFDVDPVIVRIIWFVSIFLTGSLTFWLYLIMIAVVPPEPTSWPPQSGWAPAPRPFGYAASYAPPTTGTAPDAGASAAPTGSNPADSTTGTAPEFGPNAAPPGTPPVGPQGGWWGNDWRWQQRQDRWHRRAEQWQQQGARHGYREHGAGLVFGLLLILGGGMLAWHQLDPNFDLGLTWPVLVIALGAILVASSLHPRER